MNRDFILGASLLVLGGLILASTITGTTGSIFAVFLAPGALNLKTPIAGTFRSAGNVPITPLATSPASPATPQAPTATI